MLIPRRANANSPALRLRKVAAKRSVVEGHSKGSGVGHQRKIAVIGLGYVGLPVAVAFARSGATLIGFDIDRNRIGELRASIDRTREVEQTDLNHPTLSYESDPAVLAAADFYIVTVPTPIDAWRRPDLGALLAASRTVGRVLKRGDIVVYESTVYPGAVEEDCVPVLERTRGCGGPDFTVGYSPERINPGDKEHRFETITKVVSGQDDERCKSSPTSMARSSPPASIARRRSRSPRPPRSSRTPSAISISRS